MVHKSPAKILRSIRRITKFLENKPTDLSIAILPSINILPITKPLALSTPILIDVRPTQPNLTIKCLASIDIPPTAYHSTYTANNAASLALEDFKEILNKNKDAMKQSRDQERNEREKEMENFVKMIGSLT